MPNAFKAAGQQYEHQHPDTKILFSFGSSDAVLRQIINGAPADVFASADPKAMDKAVAAKVVDSATRVDFGLNQVVMIVPFASTLDLRSVEDLSKTGVKPVTRRHQASVPVARSTEAGPNKAGFWKE